MTKSIQVENEVHEKLFVLKGLLGFTNISEVITSLMNSRKYDNAFFERIAEIREIKTEAGE